MDCKRDIYFREFLKEHIVQALADFNAEQDGDLSFKRGDRIEILETRLAFGVWSVSKKIIFNIPCVLNLYHYHSLHY